MKIRKILKEDVLCFLKQGYSVYYVDYKDNTIHDLADWHVGTVLRTLDKVVNDDAKIDFYIHIS